MASDLEDPRPTAAPVAFPALAPGEKLSTPRLAETLDFATAYGAFDAKSPDGATAVGTSPMTPERRFQIVALQELLMRRELEDGPIALAGSFEEAWAATGRQYGADALENVRLGWDLATQGELGIARVVTAARAVLAIRPFNWNDGEDPEAQIAWLHLQLALDSLGKEPADTPQAVGLARDIEAAQDALEEAKDAYLRRWGWKKTCSTPGAYWLWQRDFSAEDEACHRLRPYGLITAPRALAVEMTRRWLDDRPEDEDGDDD